MCSLYKIIEIFPEFVIQSDSWAEKATNCRCQPFIINIKSNLATIYPWKYMTVSVNICFQTWLPIEVKLSKRTIKNKKNIVVTLQSFSHSSNSNSLFILLILYLSPCLYVPSTFLASIYSVASSSKYSELTEKKT